jgi:hypothetical protein
MNKTFRFIIFTVIVFCFFSKAFAQSQNNKDSVIQLYGVVMTSDSLKAIPLASIIVKHKNRGTISNNDGVFSIAVLKGDIIIFSCEGFKNKEVKIPQNLEGDQYSMIQLLVNDTVYLPATILKPRPTKEQFDRDFANTKVPDDLYETARQNTEQQKLNAIMASLPADSREAIQRQMQQQSGKFYSQGQIPQMNISNPLAWADFIKAWKRGDFKSSSNSGNSNSNSKDNSSLSPIYNPNPN